MKKCALLIWLFCCLLSAALGENAPALPDGIRADVCAAFPDSVLLDAVQMADDRGVPSALVLLEQQGQNTLVIYQWEKDAWQLRFSTAAALPQGKQDDVQLLNMGVYPEGSVFHPYWDRKGRFPQTSDGRWLSISLEDSEKVVESVTFHWENGSLHLKQYQFGPGHYGDMEEGQIVLSNIGDDDVERISRTLNTDIQALDFYALPRYSLPGKRPPVLQLYPAEFDKDQRLPVYMGPGSQYPRSGNGKAVVSTNGPIRVMGEYNGFLLIHYEIDAQKGRYGWVSQEGLKEGCVVPPISFHERRSETLTMPCMLTDDPTGTKAPFATLEKGTRVDWLASLDEQWAYVRVEIKGKTFFGFLPANGLEESVG